jgi:hypothetical protein
MLRAREAEMEQSIYSNARKQLAERRTGLIKSLMHSSQDEQMEAHIDLIVRVQSVIDVIDRVAKEEAGSQ